MMLIGITGKAGSGKDTVGWILRDKHDFGILSFATPIKRIVCDLLGADLDKWNDRVWREAEQELWGCSPRHMAQTLGTEWGRHCIKDTLWVDLAFSVLEGIVWDRIAITDVRFSNEADIIRSPARGGYIIHVNRAESDAAPAAQRHSSEEGIGNPNTQDFHINNFGTLEDLEKQVDQVIARIVRIQEEDALAEAAA